MARNRTSSHASASVPSQAAPKRSVPLGFLVFTILCTGSGIIMLEVLGARMAGPIFGVSLYIWTALIAVTLASLSVGYYLGGILADRRPSADMMYAIVLVSGVWIGFLPWLDGPVLVAAYEAFDGAWRIRGGVLLGSTILFAPPLTLLGMVSPYAIKLALADLQHAGRTAGVLYAISTVGSVAGTILVGYWLIPGVGITNTLLIITALIVAPALLWFAMGRRWLAVVGSLIAFVVGASTALSSFGQPLPPMGTRVVEKRDSQYGQLKVFDMDRGDRPTRWLLLEGTAQTGIYKDSNELVSSYVTTMIDFLKVHPPKGRKALLVGLGGGALVKPLRDLGYELDVVEIDPQVAELAATYFGADRDSYNLITEDGRAFMRRTDNIYDVILMDVFSGGGQPFHLFSQESFQTVGDILSADGFVGLNAIAFADGENAIMPRSMVKTAGTVFAHRQTFVGDPGDPLNDIQNILMFFSKAPFNQIPAGELTPDARESLSRLQARVLHIDEQQGVLVTDDWNPVDRWTARVNEVWRERLFESMGPEVLAY